MDMDMDTNDNMIHFELNDRVRHVDYGDGFVSRKKLLGFKNCCSVQVTWDSKSIRPRLFHKNELSSLTKQTQ